VSYADANGHRWAGRVPDSDSRCLNDGCGIRFIQSGNECAGFADEEPTGRLHGLVQRDPAAVRWDEIEDWMRKKFESDLERLRSKAIEYGAADLRIMGTGMEALLPDGGSLDEESRHRAGLEMAIGFYLLGKAARLIGAWEKGREPSEDTWYDARIYADMARCVRETGRWM